MNQSAKQHAADYQTTLPVHLLRTRNEDGERCYFVIRSSAAHYTRMLAKKGKEQVNINEYGEILASGYGKHPSAQVVGLLKARYNVELTNENDED